MTSERILTDQRRPLLFFLPALSTAVLALINLQPFVSVWGVALMPALLLIAVYFWAVEAPSLLPAPVVFVIGLAFDLLAGTVPGTWALALTLLYALVSTQRHILKSPYGRPAWIGFCIYGSVTVGLLWVIGSLTGGGALPGVPFLALLLTTLAAFPLVSWVLDGVRGLLAP